MIRVLFICKQRQTDYGVSYGLLNSCKFLCNALGRLGVESKVVPVIDNNYIDREVHQYQPTHVFIEALWVVPEKFHVLLPLYPKVKWYVRLHSNTPFIASEGVAIQWILEYENIRKKYGTLQVAGNSDIIVKDLLNSRNIQMVYAPNVYFPPTYDMMKYLRVPIDHDALNIACFGAIRPMKNHLAQAVAAMTFANEMGKTLNFHINGRCEQHGEPILKSLEYFFGGSLHKLIQHPWCDHQEFIALVKEMDLGLQVSFSETFNIVAADMVEADIPIVGSDEIPWLAQCFQAHITKVPDIVFRLKLAHEGRKIHLQTLNKIGLQLYNYGSVNEWRKLLHM